MNSASRDSQNSHCAVKGPSPAPLPPLAVSEGGYHGQEDPTLASGHPATTPSKGLTDTALLPYQRALLFASCQMLTQLFARVIISIFLFSFFFLNFPFPLRSSPAPTELRETGLILIYRHELIAGELWQLFQEGVCKVISAIKPLWVGCDFFFTLLILHLESCTD